MLRLLMSLFRRPESVTQEQAEVAARLDAVQEKIDKERRQYAERLYDRKIGPGERPNEYRL